MKKQSLIQKWTVDPPNSFVFIFAFIIIAMVLTYIVPAGTYDRVENKMGQEVVIADSFHYTASSPVSPVKMFQCVVAAFVGSADIIFCILFAYCFIGIMVRNGVFDTVILILIRKLRSRVRLLLPIIMVTFGLMGSVAGLAEETFGLFPVCIALAVALGYDQIVGGAIVYLAVFTGFASATFNPFTLGVAQSIADVPLYSGLGFRLICWIVFMTILILYVMRYADKIKKDPAKSLLYVEGAVSKRKQETNSADASLTARQTLCLVLFCIVMVSIVAGAILFGWYIAEITAIFLAAAILAGIIFGWSANRIAESFVEIGAETMFSILCIGLSNAICGIMDAGCITDTIVHGMASVLEGTSGYLSGILMLVVQNLLNFFIPSGPGQAMVSMPIMSSLADVTGLSRQLSVLAFQFGDGYSNIFWPTMVCMMCGIMKIPVTKWYRFMAPLFGIMVIAQVVLLLIAVGIGY
ncbi:MAG: YfcC family protein [Eubacteriales bacterium]|nr:YfcC family protein [Eubacteriales bacterium]